MSERRIVALNNGGVDALSCGRFHEAILCFRHAVQCMKNYSESCEVSSDNPKAAFSLRPTILDCLSPDTLNMVSPSNKFELYQCAFKLPSNPTTLSQPNEILVVIIYNLALSIHIDAVLERKEQQLDEALHYYNLAMAASNLNFSPQTTSQTLVVLGCATNLGHIFSYFWKVPEAQACFDFIDDLLISIPQGEDMLQEDCFFFYSVVAYGAAHNYHFAPAA